MSVLNYCHTLKLEVDLVHDQNAVGTTYSLWMENACVFADEIDAFGHTNSGLKFFFWEDGSSMQEAITVHEEERKRP